MMYRMELGLLLVIVFGFCGRDIGVAANGSKLVAFSVGKTAHQFGKGRVVYQKVFLNVGNGYNLYQNVFIAPQAGIYRFNVNGLNYVKERDTRPLSLKLYRDEEYLVSLFERQNGYGQASNSILLKLSVGQKVYVDMAETDTKGGGLYGTREEIYSTFSGYMVAPYVNEFAFVKGVK